ncbi:hypothetical protein NP493_564g03018 [Ridgeia piscesae]|uniref:Uncharacterized protein n=1 Tax=Ridgeia piscesae TaxID=27915 RepID=A0AAD9KUT7_RIDPI|nr:hypothetical protein NP493_564g03018 [Ridgeia piscesae]
MLTHYNTNLPIPISLSSQWGCGLVEIQYLHSWYNVREDDTSLFVIDSDGSTYVGQIDAGYYPGGDALTRAINRAIMSMQTRRRKKGGRKGKLTEMPQPVSDRIMTMRLPLSKDNFATIISVYAPTMTNPDENKETFYNHLASGIPRTYRIGREIDKWPWSRANIGLGNATPMASFYWLYALSSNW